MIAALYIHIPFCPQICGYCDFYKVAHRGDSQVGAYLDALKKEIALYAADPAAQGLTFETLYFGGGTPSLLTPAQLHDIIDGLLGKFKFSSAPEVTLETDPGTVDLPRLQAFRAAGVNRLSLGVQSFQNEELEFLDRLHSADEAVATYEMARQAGFGNISIDLIFGLPGQGLASWEKTLQWVTTLAPEHLSTYCLTFEEGTPLMNKLRKGVVQKPLPDLTRIMYLYAMEFLTANGFEHYEVSNFARPGLSSRHNLKYWNGNPYLGMGTSAHSFIGKRRYWNVSHLNRYRDALAAGRFPVEGDEQLSPDAEALERIFLSLRQHKGLHVRNFEAEFSLRFFERYSPALFKFFESDFHDGVLTEGLLNGERTLKGPWLEFDSGFLRLTTAGFAVCDSICGEFQ